VSGEQPAEWRWPAAAWIVTGYGGACQAFEQRRQQDHHRQEPTRLAEMLKTPEADPVDVLGYGNYSGQ
jgi:hypothetical protein